MVPLDAHKKCTKCGVEKPKDAFTRAKWIKDGFYPSCKECKAADSKARKASDPKKYAKQQARYDRAYKDRHPGKCAEMKRRWYQENKEKAHDTAAAWRDKNREKVRLYIRMANARRRADGGRNTIKLVDDMWISQRGKCLVCKSSLKAGYHIDHVMPIKLGGTNERSNLQLLCPTCNLQKKAKHPVDFMQSRGFLL